MGGFTVIYLKDRSEENIKEQNRRLELLKVPKKHRFYSIKDVEFEFNGFMKNKGEFPEHLFPRDQIKTFEDFKRFWSPIAVGEIFVSYTGSLGFDCYFGRTSKHAMRQIGKYIGENANEILAVSGSFSTFMERGMSRWERKYIQEKLDNLTIKDTNKISSLHQSPYEKVY